MALTTFDTHELVKNLKAAGFTDDQAEAVTRAVKHARELDLSDLATRADMANSASKAGLADLKTELKAEMAAVRADVAVVAARLDSIAANYATKAELSDMRTDIIRWVFGIALGQAALIIAVVKLLLDARP